MMGLFTILSYFFKIYILVYITMSLTSLLKANTCTTWFLSSQKSLVQSTSPRERFAIQISIIPTRRAFRITTPCGAHSNHTNFYCFAHWYLSSYLFVFIASPFAFIFFNWFLTIRCFSSADTAIILLLLLYEGGNIKGMV